MICGSCGASNAPGRKFCLECGTPLATPCPACGAGNEPGAKFCGECGTPLGPTVLRPPGAARPAAPSALGVAAAGVPAADSIAAASTERRLVSVLFADLVGFTILAQDRDPEEVRDLLSRYFDTAAEVIGRYGGTVEKFIGDAVMAVWGAPVAREDDAERAVRAALDLVDVIGHLGRTSGLDDLQLRAGVLTGEAAVTIGASGQGMVAGDLVNTASRLQSVAPPGTVLVGEATHRAASGAIAFETAGEQLLTGKAAPVPAWRAVRVVAERGGTGRSEGLEAPFVGRDEQLRLLKDAYHATARDRRARLVSVTGQAGIGKSRLAWEFLKYVDGLVETVRWHQGRSPAYGEGISFWALGEMVRSRAGLTEGDGEARSREGVAAVLRDFVPDETERRWIELALLSLLGVAEAPPGGRDALFAAWRTLFERIAEDAPTVLVFEDLQWADPGMVDFIESLLEWSAGHPILVVTLARPELLDRRPTWGAGRRDLLAVSLEPLPAERMRELLDGLAPGLPERTAASILERAGGVPLYAVETVRMLVSEGRLEERDGAYRPVGDLSEIHVPETLQALISARLDALAPEDRALLQDGAVLGQTFSLPALAALSGLAPESLEPRLRTLVRREMLTLDTDPRSPERGQYGFTQALVREVAYGTLARRDRRARHVAAARYFEALGDDELAGALANHYLAAYQAQAEGPEGTALAAQARVALRAAAERAAALGSHEQALAFLEKALEVTTDPTEQADLLERAGAAAGTGARVDEADGLLRRAADLHRASGDRSAAARTVASLATILLNAYRTQPALDLLEPAHIEFADLGDDPGVAAIGGQIARAHFFLDQYEPALAWADRALVLAERLDLVAIVADAMVTKGAVLSASGRWYEGTGVVRAALDLTDRHELVRTSLRAALNLSSLLSGGDPQAAATVAAGGLEVARRLGIRSSIAILSANLAGMHYRLGDWDRGDLVTTEALALEVPPGSRAPLLAGKVAFLAARGLHFEPWLSELEGLEVDSSDLQYQATVRIARVSLAEVGARYGDMFDLARAATEGSWSAAEAYDAAARAALQMRDAERTRWALDGLRATGVRGPAIDATLRWNEAGLAALAGRQEEAVRGFRDALARLRDLGLEWDLAVAGADFVRLVGSGHPEARAAGETALAITERLRAEPFRARIDALLAGEAGAVGAVGGAGAAGGAPFRPPETRPAESATQGAVAGAAPGG